MFKKLLSQQKTSRETVQAMLFELFYSKVYKIARFLTQDEHLADDVVQETFLKVFDKVERLTDYSKIDGWIATIARHTAIDFLRKKSRMNEHPVEDELYIKESTRYKGNSVVEAKVEFLLTIEEVNRSLSELSYIHREVLLLKLIEGLSDHEIAKELGITVGTVKSRYYRAKQQIRLLCREERIQGGNEA